ncbi:glycoside hydrolase family protein [Bacteroides gallinarum]|uniref:glycoside hydrolase family protein n=1 Tax=Bacteroides gallinarum TaxID=376806 RepID=UPI00037EF38F|nr:lysozyme [Bacteroides gallinarum]
MGIRVKLLAAFFVAVSVSGVTSRAENPVKEEPDKFSLAVECIRRHEGWHGEKRHWPYVGWGHKVLPGERLTNNISKAQGDSILRADLRKLCRIFSYLGRDSLLVGVLAYNVGVYRLKGYGKMPKSNLIRKLEAGNRDIYRDYVSFRCYRGRVIPSIERRRKEEFMLLFEE